MKTAELIIKDYDWYPMPPAVHKVLIHGSFIIQVAVLSIGQLSEEAQEARHKDCKSIRQYHTRNTSRYYTNEDLFHMLLASSGPVSSSKHE